MNLKKMMVVCALALGGLAVGCGNKCKSLCEDGQKCPGADKSIDCGKSCDDLDNVSSAASCDDQKNKLLDCEDGLSDKCNETSCASQIEAFGTCVGTYCAAHPTDSSCTAFIKDNPSSS
jgi:hypothetical protein